MTRRFEGKVAFITGVARGQGRNHAVAFAKEGGSVIGVDLPETYRSLNYITATVQDLDLTVDLVEQAGGSMVAVGADVRSKAALEAALAIGIERFGRL
ncbi:MAG: SDR family mycofactocin-dependent oxidoreductase, partial [Actinomycetes bacterium]